MNFRNAHPDFHLFITLILVSAASIFTIFGGCVVDTSIFSVSLLIYWLGMAVFCILMLLWFFILD